MKKYSYILAIAAVANLCFSSTAFSSKMTLGERIQIEKENPDKKPDPMILEIYKNRQVLLVGGYLSEMVWGYFDNNVAAIRDNFGADVNTVFPASSTTIPTGAENLLNQVNAVYEATKKPVIILGHSKGGVEALYMVTKHPELILQNKVDKIILLSAAVGGSPIAYIVNDPNWGWIVPAAFKVGLSALIPEETKKTMNAMYADYTSRVSEADRETISSKVFYIPTAQEKAQVTGILTGTFDYLTKIGNQQYRDGRNDGVVLLRDQVFSQIGISSDTLKADHTTFLMSSPYSNSPISTRLAFTKAVFEYIYEP